MISPIVRLEILENQGIANLYETRRVSGGHDFAIFSDFRAKSGILEPRNGLLDDVGRRAVHLHSSSRCHDEIVGSSPRKMNRSDGALFSDRCPGLEGRIGHARWVSGEVEETSLKCPSDLEFAPKLVLLICACWSSGFFAHHQLPIRLRTAWLCHRALLLMGINSVRRRSSSLRSSNPSKCRGSSHRAPKFSFRT